MKSCIILLMTLFFFVGCGSNVRRIDIPENTKNNLDNEIKLYTLKELHNVQFNPLEKIEGISCQHLLTDPTSNEEDAIYQLKYFARHYGANGIAYVQCFKQGTSLDKNCWNTVTCIGTAIDVKLQNTTQSTKTSVGTGFGISPNGHIITNAHIVENSKKINVYYKSKSYDAELISIDHINDIAVLKIDTPIKFLPLNIDSKIKIGTEISVLGYPNISVLGEEQKATFGYINSTSGANNDARFFQISAPIQPGNSGSPLLNNHGEVIGIVTSSLKQSVALKTTGSLAQNVNYATKIYYAIPLLLDKDIPYTEEKKKTLFTKETLVEKVADSVFLITCENN